MRNKAPLPWCRSFLACITATAALSFQDASAQPVVETYDLGRGAVRLYRPAEVDAAQPLPLVVALHGYTSSGVRVANYFGLVDQVESRPFFLLTPDGTVDAEGNRFWNATDACCDLFNTGIDDVTYLEQLVNAVRADYPVDPTSIHFMGHSNGGFMSHRMACERSEWVASIVSLAGATHEDPMACAPAGPVHVLQVHGTLDPVISFGGGCLATGCYPGAESTASQWASLNGCDPAFTAQDGAFDLDRAIAGNETTAITYETNCRQDGSSSLWTMTGSGHNPNFNTDGPAENRFSTRSLDWLFSNTKSVNRPLHVEGLWFDMETDGAGFNVVKTPFGYAFYFYGYENNERFWLLSALHEGEFYSGQAVVLDLFAGPTGQGSLQDPVSSALLDLWGTLTVTFDGCTEGTAVLEGANESLTSSLMLLAPSSGNDCGDQGGAR